ncbi:MAG TPA: adenylate kinase [Acidimicrobiia bacterium]|jgi:adenylate kinase
MGSGVRLLVLGKQGAGKGTQAVRIAEHFGAPHISTGDMFRAAVAAGTPFGLKAQVFMKRGELVPDDVVIGVVAERLAKDDAIDNGFVLDGFPRTKVQAEELQRLLGPGGLDAAIDIDVPTAIVLHRISGRRVCRSCGATYHVDAPPKVDWTCDKDGGDVVQRDDDKPDSVKRRLELYEKDTRPLLDFYDGLGLLATIDGVGDPDEIFGRILDGLAALRQSPVAAPPASQ